MRRRDCSLFSADAQWCGVTRQLCSPSEAIKVVGIPLQQAVDCVPKPRVVGFPASLHEVFECTFLQRAVRIGLQECLDALGSGGGILLVDSGVVVSQLGRGWRSFWRRGGRCWRLDPCSEENECREQDHDRDNLGWQEYNPGIASQNGVGGNGSALLLISVEGLE